MLTQVLVTGKGTYHEKQFPPLNAGQQRRHQSKAETREERRQKKYRYLYQVRLQRYSYLTAQSLSVPYSMYPGTDLPRRRDLTADSGQVRAAGERVRIRRLTFSKQSTHYKNLELPTKSRITVRKSHGRRCCNQCPRGVQIHGQIEDQKYLRTTIKTATTLVSVKK